MKTYKAAYWKNEHGAEIVLTAPEHSNLSDKELIEEAIKEAGKIGLDLYSGEIVIGDWTE